MMTFDEWMLQYVGDAGELVKPFGRLLNRVRRQDQSALDLIKKTPELLKLAVFHEEVMAFLVADKTHLDDLTRSVRVKSYLLRDRKTASNLQDYMGLFVA